MALLIIVLGGLELRRRATETRSMQGLRDEAKTEQVEFTPRDKQTLVDG